MGRHLLAARGQISEALGLARSRNALPGIVETLKTAVSAGTLAHSTWAAPLAEYSSAIAAFVDSLRNVGAFDTMLPSMRKIPLRTRVAITTVGASGAIVGEGQITPISKLELAGKQLAERKAVVLLTVTEELARLAGGESAALFGRELRHGVAAETDREFIAQITDGIGAVSTNGGTAVAILQDIAGALASIDTDAASQLFVLIEASTAKAWATKTTSTGSIAFPEMTPQGGRICGMPAIVTDGLAAGTIVVANANQIAAGAGGIELDSSGQADVQMNTAPDSPSTASTVLIGLWQNNLTALKAVRYFGAERLRDNAVAVISGVSYSGNSPA